jgi:hypothetical protein
LDAMLVVTPSLKSMHRKLEIMPLATNETFLLNETKRKTTSIQDNDFFYIMNIRQSSERIN